MRQVNGRRSRAAEHPNWCHAARCHAGLHSLGEHRSEPLAVGVGLEGGRIVATRVMTSGGRHWLEMRVTAPLAAPTEPARSHTARRLLDGLIGALNRALTARP